MAPIVMIPVRLTLRERGLLLVPAAVGCAFGLVLLLLPGNRFVGAEELCSAVGLGLALRQGDWLTARLPLVAALAIYTAVLASCVLVAGEGLGTPRVYLALAASAAALTSAGALLVQRRGQPRPAADVGRWLLAFVTLRTAVAGVLGTAALFFPAEFAATFSLAGVDLFLYRLGGAALIGFTAMGIGELRSRAWSELRTPAAMVLLLAGLCAVISLASLAIGERSSLGYLVALLASAVAAATIVELRRSGR